MTIGVVAQTVGWLIISGVMISFIEHQVHAKLMHKRNFLSKYTKAFKRVFESHAIVHHQHYSETFIDEPVPPGEDKEIRLTVIKAPIKVLPLVIGLALVSWQWALCFVATLYFHHWTWNKIHLEMHKPESRGFSRWPIYKFLAQHHFMHHQYPNKNFNVVFPFADYVLGTAAPKPNSAQMLEMFDLGLVALTPAEVSTMQAEVASKDKKPKVLAEPAFH